VGDPVGVLLGFSEGSSLGKPDGSALGYDDGPPVGDTDGPEDGATLGAVVGVLLGMLLGPLDGPPLGTNDGSNDGIIDGSGLAFVNTVKVGPNSVTTGFSFDAICTMASNLASPVISKYNVKSPPFNVAWLTMSFFNSVMSISASYFLGPEEVLGFK